MKEDKIKVYRTYRDKIVESKYESEPKLTKFYMEMARELRNNSHKGNWEDFTHKESILKEFEYHFKKVLTVLEGGEQVIYFEELLKEHIADCDNILMFLGNAYGLYDK